MVMKERSKLRTLLWLIFPWALMTGLYGYAVYGRTYTNWQYNALVLAVAILFAWLYFFARKKALGVIATILSFGGLAFVWENYIPTKFDMEYFIQYSPVFSIPGIRHVMQAAVRFFDGLTMEILGFGVNDWVYAGAVYVLPGIFVLIFCLRTKKCFKLVDVEAKRAAREQKAIERRQAALRNQTYVTKSVPTGSRQAMEKLKKLNSLRQLGALTDEEYQQKKAEVLPRL